MIVALVGSGGKTTLIHKLAADYRRQGKRVFVTTSTHMFIEPNTLLSDDPVEIIARLEAEGYVMAGIQVGGKIKALSPATYEAVCSHADVVLVEADGSKHMPIKFPSEKEPVIYENTDTIIVVCGLHALGKPFKDAAHRLELVMNCLGVDGDTLVTPEHIRQLLQKGYLEPLRKRWPEKTVRVYASQDGSPEQMEIAQMLEEL